MAKNRLEAWLRGPVDGIISLLQPVAHALIQASEEVSETISQFPDAHLWDRPAGLASVGFHLQHLSGVIDRLFTYAQGSLLSEAQMHLLQMEGQIPEEEVGTAELARLFTNRVNWAVDYLKTVEEKDLLEVRGVGRAAIPSTVQGLLFHAAEHTIRHVGQLLVTAKVIEAKMIGLQPETS